MYRPFWCSRRNSALWFDMLSATSFLWARIVVDTISVKTLKRLDWPGDGMARYSAKVPFRGRHPVEIQCGICFRYTDRMVSSDVPRCAAAGGVPRRVTFALAAFLAAAASSASFLR